MKIKYIIYNSFFTKNLKQLVYIKIISLDDQKEIKNQFNDIGERVDMFLADNPELYELVSKEIKKTKYV